jgi:hypothetical protein
LFVTPDSDPGSRKMNNVINLILDTGLRRYDEREGMTTGKRSKAFAGMTRKKGMTTEIRKREISI